MIREKNKILHELQDAIISLGTVSSLDSDMMNGATMVDTRENSKEVELKTEIAYLIVNNRLSSYYKFATAVAEGYIHINI